MVASIIQLFRLSPMQNPLTVLSRIFQPNAFSLKPKTLSWTGLCLMTLGLTVWCSGGVQPTAVYGQTAQPQRPAPAATNAPAALTNLLAQVDTAASNHNLKEVMKFYGSNFTHSDGLTKQTLEKAIANLWQQYPQLKYRTEITSWKPTNNGFSVETVTQISGVQSLNGRNLVLNTNLRSRQQIANQKIVRQEVLSENTQITSGEAPPRVKINLPDQVRPGQEYNFDAIVQEPLGDSLLLGTAVEEAVKPNSYLKPASFNLELLSAGGIYKVGRAPSQPTDQWISAVLVREDGMTIVTQRLKVTNQATAAKPKPASR